MARVDTVDPMNVICSYESEDPQRWAKRTDTVLPIASVSKADSACRRRTDCKEEICCPTLQVLLNDIHDAILPESKADRAKPTHVFHIADKLFPMT